MDKKAEVLNVCRCCGTSFRSLHFRKFCSDNCAKLYHKRNRREARLFSDAEAINNTRLKHLREQEYLSVTEAALLLNVTRHTLYKMVRTNGIEMIHVTPRLVKILRSDLEKITIANQPKQSPTEPNVALISKEELMRKYSLSTQRAEALIKQSKVNIIIKGGMRYYPALELEKYCKQFSYVGITEWYTIDEVIEKFNLKRNSVYDITSSYKVPRKMEGKVLYISKSHIDRILILPDEIKENYYSIPEALEKYPISRNHMYELIKSKNLPTYKFRTEKYVQRVALDEVMSKRTFKK